MSVTTYMSTLPLPAQTMSVNGVYMEREIVGYRTSSVSGRESFTSTLTEQALGESGDTRLLGKQNPPKEILVRYNISADTLEEHKHKHNQLKRALAKPNTKFIFRDESEFYYIGTVTNVTGMMINSAGNDIFASAGEITIHCSDPYKYSTVEKTFTAEISNGVMSLTIVNNGSKAVPIDYVMTNNDDNGYFGIISEKGVIQLGKIEEVDGVDYQQSENLANIDSFVSLPDDHGVNYAHPNQEMTGTITYEPAEDQGNYFRLKTLGTEVADHWCGGMKTLILPADSNGDFGAKNFYVYMYHWFETVDISGQTGVQSISFLTDDNQVICCFKIFKSDMVNNQAAVEFRVGNNAVKYITFTPSYYDGSNPYNKGRGHNDLTKEGDKVTFYYWGQKPSFVDPTIKDMVCTKIQLSITQWAGRGLSKPYYLPRNFVKQISFDKMFVDKWKDTPNRYKLGDVVLVSGSDAKVYVNGMPKPNEEIKGSTYFLAEPGTTTVQFMYSTFSTVAPTIVAKIREAWL